MRGFFFFFFFLNTRYTLFIICIQKKWQVRSDEDKSCVQQREEKVRQKFKGHIGLIVDKPKPGFWNTNDGNTGRIFLMKPELSSDITGLDVYLHKISVFY